LSRAITHREHKISRGSYDRANALWKPSHAIADFRAAAQFCLTVTRAIEFFFAIEKIF